MMKPLPLLLLAAALVHPSLLRAADLHINISDQRSQQPLGEVVVLARPVGFSAPPAARHTSHDVSIEQVDKEFHPGISIIPQGGEANFPNNDNIQHHVYSFSKAKVFDIPLYDGLPDEPILFDKPGVVKIGCNIHDWMIGYIYVTDTPYTAKTGEAGTVTLSNLPEGSYEVSVWHPLMKSSEAELVQSVTLAGKGETLSWHLELRPNIRPRRAPLSISSGY